jgi:two-component system NtrC family sensor kinase
MLRLKILIATIIFSVVPLLALGITGYYQFSEAQRDKNLEDVMRLAENRRSALQQFFDDRMGQLISITQTQSLQRVREESHLATLLNMMRLQSKVFLDMEVVDQNGDRLAYVGTIHPANRSVNYSNEAWFHWVMSSGMYISDVFLGVANVPQLVMSVTKQEEDRTWILRAGVRSDVIDAIVKSGHPCSKGDAFVVNTGNVLQTASCFSGKILGHPSTPDFSSSIGTKVEQITEQNEENLFAIAQLTSPTWVLVIRQDLRGGAAALFKRAYLQGFILISAILLVVIGAILVSGNITNDVSRLVQEASKAHDPMMQWTKMAALGKMAAGIAHEINNPLAIIGEKAGWMKDLLHEDDVAKSENFQEIQDCVNKIRDQVERCKTVTHHLLRFGRRIAPIQEMVDINEILAETVTLFESEASFRGIDINTTYDEQLPRISTDPTQLQQVFLNIVDNAIDAIGKSGTIEIRTSVNSAPTREIVIEISDNGPGIPKHVLGRIFDHFVTTKEMGDGRGLGLSISYGIIEKLGGQIKVTSEERKGASFTICLPTE